GIFYGRYWARTSDPQLVERERGSRPRGRFPASLSQRMRLPAPLGMLVRFLRFAGDYRRFGHKSRSCAQSVMNRARDSSVPMMIDDGFRRTARNQQRAWSG